MKPFLHSWLRRCLIFCLGKERVWSKVNSWKSKLLQMYVFIFSFMFSVINLGPLDCWVFKDPMSSVIGFSWGLWMTARSLWFFLGSSVIGPTLVSSKKIFFLEPTLGTSVLESSLEFSVIDSSLGLGVLEHSLQLCA